MSRWPWHTHGGYVERMSAEPPDGSGGETSTLAGLHLLIVRTTGIAAEVLQALLDREKNGSTGIGKGVAVPHARFESLSESVLFVGISKQGVDFASLDNRPVRVFMVLLSPISDTGTSLKILAGIAALGRRTQRHPLETAYPAAQELLAYLRQVPGVVAAEAAGKAAQECGVKNIEVRIKGPGPGRESSVRALNALGMKITSISDVTPVPHNGCRPPKKRRI